jgi:hypothetical protein
VAEHVLRFIWTGSDEVRCQVEIEPEGDRRYSKNVSVVVRRIYRDGLVPLALSDGRPVEYVEPSRDAGIARAKLFLDKRFGFGTMGKDPGTTADMRVFPVERVPAKLTIAGYRRFGCPICKVGEPNEDRIDHWVEHAQREHGYAVASDRREHAPRLRNVDTLFRVVRLVRPASADAPTVRQPSIAEMMPRLMPRKLKP